MFPEAQTTPAPPDAAPSLADIVREQTQGGRIIIQFLVDAMTGNLPNFKPSPHHPHHIHHTNHSSDPLTSPL